jgi:hypothetical protein
MSKKDTNELVPFSITAKLPSTVITIEAQENAGKILFVRKVDGQCLPDESEDDCLARVSKLRIVYGDLSF